MAETPEEMWREEPILIRQAEFIYRHECLGETQVSIAKSKRISQSRGFQIYHAGKRNQRRGLI